jgi:hypothetical protein
MLSCVLWFFDLETIIKCFYLFICICWAWFEHVYLPIITKSLPLRAILNYILVCSQTYCCKFYLQVLSKQRTKRWKLIFLKPCAICLQFSSDLLKMWFFKRWEEKHTNKNCWWLRGRKFDVLKRDVTHTHTRHVLLIQFPMKILFQHWCCSIRQVDEVVWFMVLHNTKIVISWYVVV